MKNERDKYDDIDASHELVGGRNRTFGLSFKTFSSFKNSVYRLYYGALLGQMAAMNMQMFARSWLIYRLTGSAFILGIMSLANAVPMISLSLFGGVIADRVQKKYVMLMGQACSAAISLGIALALFFGYLSTEIEGSWWILMVAAVLQGTVMALMMPSRQAILPEIVGEEQLMNAVSLNTMGTNALRIFAPAATGFLIQAVDYKGVYFVMTGMYIMAVAFILFLPHTSRMTVSAGGTFEGIKEGLKYLRHETTIVIILVFTLFVVILSMPYSMLLPVLCDRVLNVGEAQAGILMSVSGIGAITGSIALASLPNKKRGLMLLVSCLVLGLSLAGFAFSTSWFVSMALIVIVGLANTGRMTLGNTLIQYYVDNNYRGRVMSIYMMEFGLVSFGTFAAGIMAETIGVQWAIGGFALVLVFMALVAFISLPRIRKLD